MRTVTRILLEGIFALLGVAATWVEAAMNEGYATCSECGGTQFTIDNWDDPLEAGTVRMDPEGKVVEVYGMLACADCGDVWLSPADIRAEERVAASRGATVTRLRVVK